MYRPDIDFPLQSTTKNRTEPRKMEQLLDSGFEALAFNCISFGIFTIVNNVWTWVAAITAAITFWRIRAAGVASSSRSFTKPNLKPWSTSIIDRAGDDPKPTLFPSALVSAPAVVTGTISGSPSVCDDIRVSTTKGEKFKLSVYCDGESNDVDGEMTVRGRSCGGEWWESWERVFRVRKGERGWYRYQDLTAINGNVVRLWDDKLIMKNLRQ
uniref:Transmembrane protein n=3 Tax=Gossypium TaxID=3633 RepID=A0A0D2QJB0_GOSRA|nr:hypothetical protein B456_001G017300 [Gossypium raimondii]